MDSGLQSWVQHSVLRVTLSGGVPPSIQRSLVFPNSPLPRAPNPSTSDYERGILQRLEREEKIKEDTRRTAEASLANHLSGVPLTAESSPPKVAVDQNRSTVFTGIDEHVRSTHPAIHEDPKPPSMAVNAALEKASLSAPSTEMGRHPSCMFTSACTFTATDRHWHCHACTFANKHDTISCEICNYLKKPEEEQSERDVCDVWSSASTAANTTNQHSNSTKMGGGGNTMNGGVNVNGSGSSSQAHPMVSSSDSLSNSKKWTCSTCTLENASQSQVCEACGTTQHNHTLV